MDNQIQIFAHEQFGKIRVVVIDGAPWFVGKDVAIALGYNDTDQALRQHVPDKFKQVITRKQWQGMASNQEPVKPTGSLFDDNSMGGVQRLMLINEPGMYRLILRSKLPKAEEFTDWVCGEVLVGIRKTGNYSIGAPKAKRIPDPVRSAAQKSPARVYLMKLSDGDTFKAVKVGISKHIPARGSEIEYDTKLTITDVYYSPWMPRKDALLVEWAFKKKFSSRLIEGEFFSVSFDEACVVIENFVNNALPTVSDFECRKILAACVVTIDKPSTKLIADKND